MAVRRPAVVQTAAGTVPGEAAKGMWLVIYIAPSQAVARRLKELMALEGLLVNLRPVGGQAAGSDSPVELLVPGAEAREAHEVLTRLLRRARK